MRLLVKLALSRQAPLSIIPDTLPRHGKRGVNQDPPRTDAAGEFRRKAQPARRRCRQDRPR